MSGKKCSYFSGSRETFRPMRCGRGSFFKIGDSADWSYLLPKRLGRGRYVLEAKAIDGAYNRGAVTRTRFRVKLMRRALLLAGLLALAVPAPAGAATVGLMVVGKERVLREAAPVKLKSRSVRVGGRRCAVGRATPLSVLAGTRLKLAAAATTGRAAARRATPARST